MVLASTKLLRGRKKVFDKMRAKFFPLSTELFLLRASDTTNVFLDLWNVDESWFFDTVAGLLYIAEGKQNLAEPMAEATHVRIGEQVYHIITDDTLAPDEIGGTRVNWTLKLNQFTERAQFKAMY